MPSVAGAAAADALVGGEGFLEGWYALQREVFDESLRVDLPLLMRHLTPHLRAGFTQRCEGEARALRLERAPTPEYR